jgi:hypothetical protein
VAIQGSFHGVLRDGKIVDVRFADFFTIGSDGTISRRDTFFFAPLIGQRGSESVDLTASPS